MKPCDEIKELDEMVNERDALIRRLIPLVAGDLTKHLTGDQCRLVENICLDGDDCCTSDVQAAAGGLTQLPLDQ